MTDIRRQLLRAGSLLLTLAVCIGLLSPAAAQQLDPYAFEIDSAATRLADGVYVLDADVDFRLSPAAREALGSGVALTFVLRVELERKRDWWVNAEVASLTQRYRLRYHALSERYVLTNLNTGESRSFSTEPAALAALGRIEGLPIIDRRLLKDGGQYELWLQTALDIDELPAPLRTVAYMSPQWRLVSEWFVWRFKD